MKEFGWIDIKKAAAPGKQEREQVENLRRAEIVKGALRACQEGRSISFLGVYYYDPWDLRDAVERSGRTFAELVIVRDDNEEFAVI